MPALLAAAGTHCAIFYACFHSNPVDTAEREKHGHSQLQELGSGTRVDAAFHLQEGQDGGLCILYIYILYFITTLLNSPHIKALSNGNIKLLKREKY